MSSSRLRRKGGTLYVIIKNNDNVIKKPIPIHSISSLYVFNEIDLNTKLLKLLSKNGIPVHFFNNFGFYYGSYIPRKNLISGYLTIEQVKNYLDNEKRMKIAKEFVKGAIHNSIKNLFHYKKLKIALDEEINALKNCLEEIENCKTRDQLMSVEGRSKQIYYSTFEKFLGKEFKLEKRVRRPPDNMINCLISFGNSLLYTLVLSEIYHTQLDPGISFLHEPLERRFSLALDIAEVFKPVIVDKVIFKLINNRMINEKHFVKELNFTYLNEKGRRLFLEQFDARIQQTIYYSKLKRHVSYRKLIRLECYKLIKHLINDGTYKSFKMKW